MISGIMLQLKVDFEDIQDLERDCNVGMLNSETPSTRNATPDFLTDSATSTDYAVSQSVILPSNMTDFTVLLGRVRYLQK